MFRLFDESYSLERITCLRALLRITWFCRGELVQRVASMLNSRLLPLVPEGLFPSWHVFGSSANTFGMDTSDVDMCVIWKAYDGNLVSPPISPPDIVTIAAAVANDMGMLDVRDGLCDVITYCYYLQVLVYVR